VGSGERGDFQGEGTQLVRSLVPLLRRLEQGYGGKTMVILWIGDCYGGVRWVL
jgi:hypothetical protein